MSELKPCPFCASEAIEHSNRRVGCGGHLRGIVCPIRNSIFERDDWNRRAAPSAGSAGQAVAWREGERKSMTMYAAQLSQDPALSSVESPRILEAVLRVGIPFTPLSESLLYKNCRRRPRMLECQQVQGL